LVSKLRQKLEGRGSLLYDLKWKNWDMPSGPAICALRASVRRISAKDSGSEQSGWPTPNVDDSKNSGLPTTSRADNARPFSMLPVTAQLAGWPTPRVQDSKHGEATEYEMKERWNVHPQLHMAAALAGWPTPLSQHANGTPEDFLRRKRQSMERGSQSMGVCLSDLNMQVQAWAADSPLRLTHTGELLTGSSAEMESGGQLNPEHSRWLMGYPEEWGFCGATAMQSSPRSRRSPPINPS
jgi:hypothetical protein